MVTRGLGAGRRAGWVAAVVAAWVLASASPAAANWIVHAAVAPAIPSGQLEGISCWSTSGCLAVGSAASRSGVPVAVAERWNGQRWTTQPAAIPAGAGGSVLDSISCISRRLCVAVGGVRDRAGGHELALTERWAGMRWSVVPNPGRGQLDGVSCTSRSACEAVGEDVIERWNGKRWSVADKLRGEQSLASVSCASATDCMAVGESYGESNGVNFAERYDGRRWARQSIPTPGDEEDFLTGVSCVSARICLAAGATIVDSDDDAVTVTERWNGSKWSIQDPPNEVPGQTLNNLSCSAVNACVAVGTFTTFLGSNRPLVERWNGHRWAVRFTARPRGAQGGTFAAVSCFSRRVCDAVGSFNVTRSGSHPLAEQIDDSRSRVQPTAGFVGGTSGALNGVSCTSAGACTAVGDYVNRAGTQVTLAEREAGGGWVVEPTPTVPTATVSTLSAVSCASGAACAAVGEYCESSADLCSEDEGEVPLAQIWDGSNWRTVPVPHASGSPTSQLGAVSCMTPTSCVAVGNQVTSTGVSPLIEAWNGSTWAIEDGPTPPGSNNSRLTGLSCSSPTACTAVGWFSGTSTDGSNPFVEVWNGSTWAFQTPSANGGGQLNSVSCLAPGSCVAVGGAATTAEDRALIETSAGSSWSATIPSGLQASLAGVSCGAKEVRLAVGESRGPAAAAMWALGWDGDTWMLQDVRAPIGATSGQFNAVSCSPGGPCVAVGSFVTSLSPSQPVIEERS